MIDKKLLRNYARILIHYSAAVKPRETVGIYGSELALPLVREIYREVLKAGAYPLVRLSFDGSDYLFYRYANNWQLDFLPPTAKSAAQKIDVRLVLLSSGNTRRLSRIDPAKMARSSKAMESIKDIILKKDRWTLALYPTLAYAQDAGMALEEFEDFIIRGVKAHHRQPVQAWRKVERSQNKIIRKLQRANKIEIIGEDTHLTLSAKGRKFINSCGTRNMPSGEVFTSPVENSAEGHIKFSFPACLSGNEVDGVYLEFKKGKVIKATAEKNQRFLDKMLDTDKGARRLGEFAFGLNYDIQDFTKNILFDEKIGGTIHLAVGSSYPETGGKNKSALHWDMVKDLRKKGEVRVNGKPFFVKGKVKA